MAEELGSALQKRVRGCESLHHLQKRPITSVGYAMSNNFVVSKNDLLLLAANNKIIDLKLWKIAKGVHSGDMGNSLFRRHR